MNSTDWNDLLERYRKLNDLARDLASTLELSALLNRIVLAASELLDAQAASIMLYDEKEAQLRFETTTNLDDPLVHGVVVPVENSIAGWIVTNRQPIIISDAQQDPRPHRHRPGQLRPRGGPDLRPEKRGGVGGGAGRQVKSVAGMEGATNHTGSLHACVRARTDRIGRRAPMSGS